MSQACPLPFCWEQRVKLAALASFLQERVLLQAVSHHPVSIDHRTRDKTEGKPQAARKRQALGMIQTQEAGEGLWQAPGYPSLQQPAPRAAACTPSAACTSYSSLHPLQQPAPPAAQQQLCASLSPPAQVPSPGALW